MVQKRDMAAAEISEQQAGKRRRPVFRQPRTHGGLLWRAE
jgi:hypothetical protein